MSPDLCTLGLAGMHLTNVWKVVGSIPIWNSDSFGGGVGSSVDTNSIYYLNKSNKSKTPQSREKNQLQTQTM